jgi:hypothetical protein
VGKELAGWDIAQLLFHLHLVDSKPPTVVFRGRLYGYRADAGRLLSSFASLSPAALSRKQKHDPPRQHRTSLAPLIRHLESLQSFIAQGRVRHRMASHRHHIGMHQKATRSGNPVYHYDS